MARIIRPSNTSLLDAIRQHPLLQQRLLLNRIDIQARAHMPRDMAMERPHAGIVREILQHDVARCGRRAGLNELHISALRVGLVGNGTVPGADALG